jgi:hypothetical protein
MANQKGVSKNDQGVHVATPVGGEHVRHIETTKEDRARYAQEFREEKQHQQKLKEERFAKIEARRKNKPGGGGGINIEVEGD